MRTAPLRRFGRATVLAALAFAELGFGTIYEDELECEQATAHLLDCCPDLDPHTIVCRHPEACETNEESFTIEESQCIEEASCDAVREAKLCELAPALSAIRAESGADPGVCP
jgi:hypothetical protein